MRTTKKVGIIKFDILMSMKQKSEQNFWSVKITEEI